MRIQIVVDDAYRGMLDELREATGLHQWQDLFNEAITMLSWAVRQRQNGRIVTSLNEAEENYRELQMPSLERSASYARNRAAAVEENMPKAVEEKPAAQAATRRATRDA